MDPQGPGCGYCGTPGADRRRNQDHRQPMALPGPGKFPPQRQKGLQECHRMMLPPCLPAVTGRLGVSSACLSSASTDSTASTGFPEHLIEAFPIF